MELIAIGLAILFVLFKALFPEKSESERDDAAFDAALHESMRIAGVHWEAGYMVKDNPNSTGTINVDPRNSNRRHR